MAHQYNSDFMSYTDKTSRLAAQTVIALLKNWFAVGSTLDVGCAKGTWLSVWSDTGTRDIQGIDGDYVDPKTLAIPAEQFSARDLSKSLDLSRHFDIVQSLEVAEHIQASSADTFVDNLVRHASGLVLFSAAPPGQGGEFHVNEQPYEYWRKKFASHEYIACDCLRPRIVDSQQVSFWYRYNILLYVHKDRLPDTPADVRNSVIPISAPIRDISPYWFRLRKTIVRYLPCDMREWLARSKARRFSR